jgi:hypothetical protein
MCTLYDNVCAVFSGMIIGIFSFLFGCGISQQVPINIRYTIGGLISIYLGLALNAECKKLQWYNILQFASTCFTMIILHVYEHDILTYVIYGLLFNYPRENTW